MSILLLILCIVLSAATVILSTIVWVLKKSNKHLGQTLFEMMTPMGDNQRNERYYELVNQWLWLKNQNIHLGQYLEQKKLYSFAIYGAGELGVRLMEELGNEFVYFVDQNPEDTIIQKELVKKPDEIKMSDRVDAIIVTPIHQFSSIKETLSILPFEAKVISLEEMVFGVSDIT